ncbi:XRE family transcriptional regulator [Streptomyces sp. NPDC058284]
MGWQVQLGRRDLEGRAPIYEAWRTVVEGVTGAMAYIADRHWDVVACNAEFRALFPDGRAPANIMRWMLLDDRAREGTLLNWAEDWAWGACPAVRRAVTNDPADPELVNLAHDVRHDPVAGPIYLATAAAHALHPDGAVRRINHAVRGPGWVIATAANPLPEIAAQFVMMQYRPGPTRPHQPPPLRKRAG